MKIFFKKGIVFLLIFVFVSNTVAAEIFITLKPDTLVSRNRKFYIQNIVDSRMDTSNIGFTLDSTWGKKRITGFEKGFSNEILGYFDSVLPKQGDQIPIIMEFKELDISYKFNAFAFQSKLVYRATSDILFYTNIDSIPNLCYETAFVEETVGITDVSQNIKNLLIKSLNGFSSDYWQDSPQVISYPKTERQKEEKPIFKNKYINAATDFVLYSATTYVFFMLVMLTTKGN